MIRATSVRRSFRWTMRSMKPCCRRNSLVWTPSGSSSRTVFQMVRLPAKPIIAPGSARVRSPCRAKLAATPPIVGLVRTETYSPPARPAADEPPAHHGRVGQPRLLLLGGQPLVVGDAVAEAERVDRAEVGEPL